MSICSTSNHERHSVRTAKSLSIDPYGDRAREGDIVSIVREEATHPEPRVIALKTGLSPEEMETERRALEILRASRSPVSAARLCRLCGVTLGEWLHQHEAHLIALGLMEVTPRGRIAA